MSFVSRLSVLSFIICLTIMQAEAFPGSKRVREVTGRCEITRHITLEQAEQKALEDAKVNAMRKAGVPERLWSVTGLISEDDGSEFSQVLSKMTTLAIDGFVTVKSVSYGEEMIDGRRYAVATIDADVIRSGDVDPTFALNIKGINWVYGDGEVFSFITRIYGHDAYLRIFWFDKSGGSLVYPSEAEPDRLFKKDSDYSFPINPSIEYVMEKADKGGKPETINLIAVAVKRDIPFLEDEVTFDSVLKWIYTIPANERAAFRESIMIQ